MKLEVNREGLKLNGKHQLLVSSDDFNLTGLSINIIRKKTGTLLD
jgi:hypothetical protein